MGKGRVSVIMIETPSNPLNTLVDIALITPDRGRDRRRPRATARSSSATTPCSARSSRSRSSDGADISVYSLTKYVGGHSDLIAGAALGSKELMKTVRLLRSAIGTQLDPHSCWMLGRSLETLALAHERGEPQWGDRGGIPARAPERGEGPPPRLSAGGLAGRSEVYEAQMRALPARPSPST